MPVAIVSKGSIRQPAEAGPDFNKQAGGKTRTDAEKTFAAELSAMAPPKLSTGAAKKDPFVQLEAVFLRNFVEAMLPAENAGMFGTGSAGEYWRSMLADQMANAVAVNGSTGIADVLRTRLNKD